MTLPAAIVSIVLAVLIYGEVFYFPIIIVDLASSAIYGAFGIDGRYVMCGIFVVLFIRERNKGKPNADHE